MLSLSQTQSPDLRQYQRLDLKDPGYKAYKRAALKAFRKQKVFGRVFYTCNVDRLRACDRLGDKKQVALWKTHFFLRSRHFEGVYAVAFNRRPGEELASFSKLVVNHLFIVCGGELVYTAAELRLPLCKPLEFASAEVEKLKKSQVTDSDP